jgi:hypothetical protein
MTLILSCLTADTVFQVSDRRLTLHSDAETIGDDDRNKAVFLGRVSFGYTGLANIGVVRTDDWLAKIISQGPTKDMTVVAERIRVAATEAFRGIPRRIGRHVFEGVGWFRLAGANDLRPGLISIHNCFDDKTATWLPEASAEFRISTQFPSSFPGKCILHSAGVDPTPQEKSAVVRLVRKCAKRQNSAAVLQAMIRSMSWLSGRHARIGNSFLAVSIPKRSVEESERTGRIGLFAAPPNDRTASFLYVSAGKTVWHGPHMASEGTVLTGFQCGPASELPESLRKQMLKPPKV